jgi:uncharacterized integral membrane protein
MQDKSGTIDISKSQVINFLMKKYEIYIEGYNYRDKMVNDIFFRIIQVFQLFLIIIVISTNLVETNSGCYSIICYIIIGFVGFLTMGSLLLTLQSLSSGKAEIRKQCRNIEDTISKLCPIEAYLETSILAPEEKANAPNLKYWDAIQKRDKYKWEKSKFINKFEQKNTFRINISKVIIGIWILIILIVIINHPDLTLILDFIKKDVLHLPT